MLHSDSLVYLDPQGRATGSSAGTRMYGVNVTKSPSRSPSFLLKVNLGVVVQVRHAVNAHRRGEMPATSSNLQTSHRSFEPVGKFKYSYCGHPLLRQ